MTDLIERTLRRLSQQLHGRLSMPGADRYAAATAIWAKPTGRNPRAVAHCLTAEDVQSAIRAARDGDLSLSVRGGGHDWAGRALCDGLVVDLSGMKEVVIGSDNRTAQISGGARAADVLAVTDPFDLAAVTGSVGAVGMAGFTLGGGYGALIGRFGLALDNLLAAEVVLADGRVVVAKHDNEEELFWALRGGGGNFGVVTAMRHRLHNLPSVRSGMLIYPSSEAQAILESCADITASTPEGLTVQLGFVAGPDGAPVVFVAPTWCGLPEEGEARVAPFLKLGTLLASTVEVTSYSASLTAFDAYIVNGQRTFMETCWLPALDSRSTGVFIQAMETAVSPGCAVFTHEFKGAASRVPEAATAFAFAATMCSSRSSPRSPIGRTGSKNNDISSGPAPLFGTLIKWYFPVDIRTSSRGAMRTARRKAMVATSNGSSKPSGITIPITSSAPRFHCQSVRTVTGVMARL